VATERLIVLDTTLRDGCHCLDAPLPPGDRLAIARELALLGVDVIEAGYPAGPAGDMESIAAIAAEVTKPSIAALAAARPAEIDAAARALEKAARPRIHVFLPTGSARRERNLQEARAALVRQTRETVARARRLVDDVEFSPFDATRTEEGLLAELLTAAIEEGAKTVNISDTLGCCLPEEFGILITRLKAAVSNSGGAVLSVHCHNDLGLAVANSLAAIRAGARQVECTVNGIGERAGNAALEEIVMAIATRNNYYGMETGVDSARLLSASRLVSRFTGLRVQENKAIVGDNAFRHRLNIQENRFQKKGGPIAGVKPLQ
jgi:2-isopropylmalate synthase